MGRIDDAQPMDGHDIVRDVCIRKERRSMIAVDGGIVFRSFGALASLNLFPFVRLLD